MVKRRKRKPRIRANFYSIEKIIYRCKNFKYVSNSKGYLYSGASIMVKITKDDLPAYFVPGRIRKCFGYIRTNKVKDLVFIPRTSDNHFLKDDILLISYNEPIIKDSCCGDLFNYYGYDEYILGLDIITFLRGVAIFSQNVDISGIVSILQSKKESLLINDLDAYEKEAKNIKLNDFYTNIGVAS